MGKIFNYKLGEELEEILLEEFDINTSINFDECEIYIEDIIGNDSVNEFMHKNEITIGEIEDYVLYKINVIGWN